jgi:TonB family protein
MAKELRQVHEFEADALIVKAENIENYAHMLLSSTLGGDLAYPEKAIAPSPFFNSSLNKTRITMLYQKESPQWKKSIYLAVLPLLATMTLIACNKAQEESPITSTQIENQESLLSLDQIDRFPVPPGVSETASAEELKSSLIKSISSHIANNFEYPVLAQELGMEGKIHVQFVIDKNGELTDIKVLRSLEAKDAEEEKAVLQAEQEATALIASIPKFNKPALKDGKAVNLKMVLPISLKLN